MSASENSGIIITIRPCNREIIEAGFFLSLHVPFLKPHNKKPTIIDNILKQFTEFGIKYRTSQIHDHKGSKASDIETGIRIDVLSHHEIALKMVEEDCNVDWKELKGAYNFIRQMTQLSKTPCC